MQRRVSVTFVFTRANGTEPRTGWKLLTDSGSTRTAQWLLSQVHPYLFKLQTGWNRQDRTDRTEQT